MTKLKLLLTAFAIVLCTTLHAYPGAYSPTSDYSINKILPNHTDEVLLNFSSNTELVWNHLEHNIEIINGDGNAIFISYIGRYIPNGQEKLIQFNNEPLTSTIELQENSVCFLNAAVGCIGSTEIGNPIEHNHRILMDDLTISSGTIFYRFNYNLQNWNGNYFLLLSGDITPTLGQKPW